MLLIIGMNCITLQKLTEKGKYGITLYQPQDNYQILLPFVWQNGGDILDDKGRVIVDQPEFVEAFEYYTRFLQKNLHLLEEEEIYSKILHQEIHLCFFRTMDGGYDQRTNSLKSKVSGM